MLEYHYLFSQVSLRKNQSLTSMKIGIYCMKGGPIYILSFPWSCLTYTTLFDNFFIFGFSPRFVIMSPFFFWSLRTRWPVELHHSRCLFRDSDFTPWRPVEITRHPIAPPHQLWFSWMEDHYDECGFKCYILWSWVWWKSYWVS